MLPISKWKIRHTWQFSKFSLDKVFAVFAVDQWNAKKKKKSTESRPVLQDYGNVF